MKEIIRTRFIKVVTVCMLLCSITPVNAADLTVTVNAASYIRAIPDTMYGTNLMAWDGYQSGSNTNFNNLMLASGRKYMRWPGGSWGDAYLWSDMEGPGGAYTWRVSYDETLYLFSKLSSINPIMQPIVNFPGYWYDTLNGHEAAVAAAVAWVQDQSSRIPCARYWEIGNETGGSWEAGWFEGISGTYYGDYFADFNIAMKAVNPQIKIGADANPYNVLEPWFYVGYWTHDTLVAAYAKGVVPDFLIVHSYPGSGSGPSYNPTLLGAKVDEIGKSTSNFTTSMNNIITASIGAQYVGKIKYYMTEWDAGGISYDSQNPTNPYYERWKAYVNAMFQSQYILEMAKYGWIGSNPWNQEECDNTTYAASSAYPVWYISPLLSNKFGRDMVTASSTNSTVRAYASRDDANNLTIFMVNNYPSTDRTVHINISGFSAGTSGERWLIEPAGAMIPGGLSITIQDYDSITINGVVHPDPCALNWLNGVSITTSNSFDVNLPRSRMLLIKIPPASPSGQLPYGGVVRSIPGTIEAEDYDVGGQFVAYYDTTTGNSGGQYRSDDVDIVEYQVECEECNEVGYSVAGIAAGEWLEYTVDVEPGILAYKLEVRVASENAGGNFHIEFDRADVTGPLSFAATGDEDIYTTVDTNIVLQSPGQHIMRFSMDGGGEWNVDRIKFIKVGGGTGKILREWWTGITGSSVSILTSNVNYPHNPTGRELITKLEGPTNWANNYGTRIRGYLHPALGGIYTFWIASDDYSELWLSTDSNPSNAVRIARVSGLTNPRQWTKYPTQKSSPISLRAGQKYYIEVLHKEGTSNDNIAVAWQGPGLNQQVIDGLYLSPYIINFMDFARFGAQWYRTGCTSANGWCSGADFNHSSSVRLDDLKEFVDNWLVGAD
jgi:hypothetical protein